MPNFACGHNYLYDALFHGFVELAEAGLVEVEDYPRAPWLHLRPARQGSWLPDPAARDACGLDCDAALPYTWLTSGGPDLIVGAEHCWDTVHQLVNKYGETSKFVVVDGNDNPTNSRGQATAATRGRLLAYFKRELPIGAEWAIPLPFTYSETRVPLLDWGTKSGCAYYATSHGSRALSRIRIAEDLKQLPDTDVMLFIAQTKRPSPEQLHEKLARALVGVHWNPFGVGTPHGWDANRFWENCAYGLVTVGQYPFIQIPHPFTDGENVVWIDSPEEVGPAAKALLDDRPRALKMAQAAHDHFLKFHSAICRATYLLGKCGFELDVPANITQTPIP